MKYRICYLYMEIRKTFRIMPRMALQAVLLMTVMGLVVAVGAGSMKSDPLAVSVDIAVAVEEDNVMTRMALRYVENMESVSRFCHFQQVTKEEGSRMLEKGQVAGTIGGRNHERYESGGNHLFPEKCRAGDNAFQGADESRGRASACGAGTDLRRR